VLSAPIIPTTTGGSGVLASEPSSPAGGLSPGLTLKEDLPYPSSSSSQSNSASAAVSAGVSDGEPSDDNHYWTIAWLLFGTVETVDLDKQVGRSIFRICTRCARYKW
jgi:hypothetical protein